MNSRCLLGTQRVRLVFPQTDLRLGPGTQRWWAGSQAVHPAPAIRLSQVRTADVEERVRATLEATAFGPRRQEMATARMEMAGATTGWPAIDRRNSSLGCSFE